MLDKLRKFQEKLRKNSGKFPVNHFKHILEKLRSSLISERWLTGKNF